MINKEEHRALVLYYLCDKHINIGEIDKYMYIYQKVGFMLNYRFKLGVHGIKSRVFSAYLEEQFSYGFVTSVDKKMSLTTLSLPNYEDMVVTKSEDGVLDNVFELISPLEPDKLDLLVAADLLLNDTLKSNNIEALVSSRSYIESTLSNLCSAYTKENFNSVIAVISTLDKIQI